MKSNVSQLTAVGLLAAIVSMVPAVRAKAPQTGTNSSAPALSPLEKRWQELETWNAVERMKLSNELSKDNLEGVNPETSQKRAVERERINVEYRERGLKLAKESTGQDARSLEWRWLETTAYAEAPKYWKDPEQGAQAWSEGRPELAIIDVAAAEDWRATYLTLRAKALAAYGDNNDMRMNMLRDTVFFGAYKAARDAVRAGETVDLSELAERFLDMCWYLKMTPGVDAAASDRIAGCLGDDLLRLLSNDLKVQAATVAAMKFSPLPGVRDLAAGYSRIVDMQSNPLQLTLPGLRGGSIDIGGLRGKVVLVDFWSNACGGCLDAMPKLEQIYEKYKNDGFVIVGVNLTADPKGKDKAIDNLRVRGVKYPNASVYPDWPGFCAKWGMVDGMPVTWLLGRDGKLNTMDVDTGNLEPKVRALLGLPPLPVKGIAGL